MNSEFFTALDLIEKEKGIPKEYLIEKVEAALLAAYKQEYRKDVNCNVRIVIDPNKKDVKMYKQYNVVETVENPYC